MVRVVGIEPREYQKRILETCKRKNTLVILPTGTGKTIIALMLTAERLNLYPDSKVIFLAPTKPLVNQHKNTFSKHLEDIDKTRLVVITGDIRPERRKELYKFGKIIFVTPQTLQNDLLMKRVSLENVSLIIFDEAHRAVGKYPYVYIAREYFKQSRFPRVLGLTASPGHDLERIKEVIRNLGIEAIEIRVGTEPDIKPYIKPIKIKRIEVEFHGKLKEIQELLKNALEIRYQQLKELGYVTRKLKGKKEILEKQKELQQLLANDPENEKIKKSISLLAEVMKLDHALEVFETQTLYTFIKYCESLFEKAQNTRIIALKNVTEDPRFRKAYVLAKEAIRETEHPKLLKLVELVKELVKKNKKIIIFAQIRYTVDRIIEFLRKENIACEKFVGKKEMSRDKQLEILRRFSLGEFNVLVATSIAEEGLDIPKVDTVIFYEPVPSEIRYIQRRGRTGRSDIGEVIILITKNSRDEIYYWASVMRERKMIKTIKWLKEVLKKEKIIPEEKKEEKPMLTLDKFAFVEHKIEKPEPAFKGLRIVADYREKASGVVQELTRYGILVELKNLPVGDYLVGDILIERKSKLDFVNSIIDGRLWEQLDKLKEYNSILILEGEEDLYSIRNVHPNLIRGVLLKIAADYKIPIIFTKDFRDTALFIKLLAEKQKRENKEIILKKKSKSLTEIQIDILTSFPGIGKKLALELLKKFKSLKNIFNASIVELSKVIGETRARKFKEILEKEFKAEEL